MEDISRKKYTGNQIVITVHYPANLNETLNLNVT